MKKKISKKRSEEKSKKFKKIFFTIVGTAIFAVIILYSISIRSNMTGNVACTVGSTQTSNCMTTSCTNGASQQTCSYGWFWIKYWKAGNCVETNPHTFVCGELEGCFKGKCECSPGYRKFGEACTTKDCYPGHIAYNCEAKDSKIVPGGVPYTPKWASAGCVKDIYAESNCKSPLWKCSENGNGQCLPVTCTPGTSYFYQCNNGYSQKIDSCNRHTDTLTCPSGQTCVPSTTRCCTISYIYTCSGNNSTRKNNCNNTLDSQICTTGQTCVASSTRCQTTSTSSTTTTPSITTPSTSTTTTATCTPVVNAYWSACTKTCAEGGGTRTCMAGSCGGTTTCPYGTSSQIAIGGVRACNSPPC